MDWQIAWIAWIPGGVRLVAWLKDRQRQAEIRRVAGELQSYVVTMQRITPGAARFIAGDLIADGLFKTTEREILEEAFRLLVQRDILEFVSDAYYVKGHAPKNPYAAP